jgi:AhpD family alkylhydroperoxidase
LEVTKVDNQLQYLEEVAKSVDEFKQELPEAFTAQSAFNETVYKDSVLSTKMKRLMAMAIAVRAGCPGCITYQTKLAVDAGATKAEVVEAASVATSMGGTTANAWVWIVVQMMKELGKW